MISDTRQEEINNVLSKVIGVSNMTSSSGHKVANQFIIHGVDFGLFQSYQSPIAMRYNGKTYLFRDWDFSRTTGKYRNQYLREGKKETLRKLKSGEYIAVDFEVR